MSTESGSEGPESEPVIAEQIVLGTLNMEISALGPERVEPHPEEVMELAQDERKKYFIELVLYQFREQRFEVIDRVLSFVPLYEAVKLVDAACAIRKENGEPMTISERFNLIKEAFQSVLFEFTPGHKVLKYNRLRELILDILEKANKAYEAQKNKV